MANDLPQVGAEAVLLHDQYDRDIADVIKKADKLDKIFDDMSGDVDVKINVDDGDVNAAYSSLLDLEKDADVKVNVDDADLDSAAKMVNDLDAAAPDVKVSTDDADVDATVKKVNDLDSAKPDVEVDAKDAALDKVLDKLDQIRDLSVIEVALNLSEKAEETITKIAEVTGVGTVLETGAAAQQLRGQTGMELPGVEKQIQDLYTSNWGDSIDQIKELYAALLQADVAQQDLASTATDVFQAMTVTGTDDPVEMFQRMDTLVKNNLVGDLGEAADAISYFSQQGLNRGGDLMDTIDEYSQTLKDSGLSLGAWFKIQSAGIDAGVRDTDKLADSYKEMFNLTREEVGNINTAGPTDRTNALQSLGMLDEAQAYSAGQLTADQYAAGLLDSLKAVDDPTKQRSLGLAIFGPSMVEDAGLPALLAADLSDSSEMSDAWQGIADEGSAIITDTLQSAWSEAMRTLQVEVGSFLDEQFDLTGRLKTAKDQFKTFIAELKDGKSVGEALEISFGIEGVDTALGNIERIFGNLVIELLGIVASVQEFTGHGDVAAGTRATQERLAEGQFSFDIKLADTSELDTIITQAMSRGVDASKLGNLAGKSVDEFIASGELEKAQALLDALNNAASAVVTPGLDKGADLAAHAILDSGDVEMINAAINEGILIQPEIDTAGLQKKIDDAQAEIDAKLLPTWVSQYGTATTKAGGPTSLDSGRVMGNSSGAWWDSFKGMAGSQQSVMDAWNAMIPPDDVRIKIDDAATAVTDLDTSTQTATENVANNFSDLNITLTDSTAAIITTLDTTAAKVEELDTRTATALTDNTVTASFDAVKESADVNFPAVMQWLDMTGQKVAAFDMTVAIHLNSVNKMLNDLNFLALQTIANVTAAQALGGTGQTTNNTTNNVNVTNNNSNGAQTSNSQYQLNNMLGGG